MGAADQSSLKFSVAQKNASVAIYADDQCSVQLGKMSAPISGECTEIWFSYDHEQIEAFVYEEDEMIMMGN